MAGIIPLGVQSGSANDIKITSVADTRSMTDVPSQLGILLTVQTGGIYSNLQLFFQRGTTAVWFRTEHINEGYENVWRKIV